MFSFKKRSPTLVESLIPVVLLIALLVACIRTFGENSTSGPSQIALIAAGVIALLFAMFQGASWVKIELTILKNIQIAMQAILILLLIGALMGVWILAGVVPTMIVWGLQLIAPSVFLFSACVICIIVSTATGSSWSTVGTVGLALIGIGNVMGIHPGLSAGAIISGAYFGDKMSPLSDTTNLAPSVAGTDIYSHIRHMVYTTTPSIIITLIIFLMIGLFQYSPEVSDEKVAAITDALRNHFDTGIYVLIPPAAVVILVVRKVPAIPALLVGIGLGVIIAGIFQGEVIRRFVNEPGFSYGMNFFKGTMVAASTGYSADTGIKEVDSLLNRGGMRSMLSTIWLILSAMFFGGIMEGSGMLSRITHAVLSLAKTSGSLVIATISTCIFINLTAAEQYLSILLTGRMYRESFDHHGLDEKNLSRALEDSGTLTSVLIPWNTCGAFISAALGVSTLTYLPFALFNLINPLVAIAFAIVGFSIPKKKAA